MNKTKGCLIANFATVPRQGLHAQIYCILQIAYFKAKHLFFRFGWSDVMDDCNFILSRYFHGEPLPEQSPTKHERYAQREKICALYGYRPWSSTLSSQLEHQAIHVVRRDVTPGFVATELIIWLNEHKIIRPGYTTLQELVSRVLSDERLRLERILAERLDDTTIAGLGKLIERDDTLSRLAVHRLCGVVAPGWHVFPVRGPSDASQSHAHPA